MNEKDVRAMLHNPTYVGIGPYPAILSEEEWVKAAKKLVEEEGVEQYLKTMISVLRESMAGTVPEFPFRKKP